MTARASISSVPLDYFSLRSERALGFLAGIAVRSLGFCFSAVARPALKLNSVMPNVRANRHLAAGRVWARLFEPKPGPPQSVRLSDQLGHSEQKHKWNWLQQREEFKHAKVRILHNFYLNT